MATSNKLFTIYGARLSKDKSRVNISLLNTENDVAEWAMCSVSKTAKGKTKVKVMEDHILVKIPLLKEKTRRDEEIIEEIEEISF